MSKKSDKLYKRSDELRALADQIILSENIDKGEAEIEYLFVWPNISKNTGGKCLKPTKELLYYSKCDFIIEISQEVWDELTEEDQYRLLHHELCHIGSDYDEKTGEYTYSIRKHDIEDFKAVVSKYGVEWDNTIKAQIYSLYDVDLSTECLNK